MITFFPTSERTKPERVGVATVGEVGAVGGVGGVMERSDDTYSPAAEASGGAGDAIFTECALRLT